MAQAAIARETEALRGQIENLLGIHLTPELAVSLYEAALGAEGMVLYRVVNFYGFESDRCRQSEAYFSACLMVSSATEELLAILRLLSQLEVEKTTMYQSLKDGESYREKTLHAPFEKYIQLATNWVGAVRCHCSRVADGRY